MKALQPEARRCLLRSRHRFPGTAGKNQKANHPTQALVPPKPGHFTSTRNEPEPPFTRSHCCPICFDDGQGIGGSRLLGLSWAERLFIDKTIRRRWYRQSLPASSSMLSMVSMASVVSIASLIVARSPSSAFLFSAALRNHFNDCCRSFFRPFSPAL